VSYDREPLARSWAASIEASGISSEVVSISVNGKTYYRVRFPVQGSRDEARRLAAQSESELDIRGAWVSGP
jgi:hypothetical protein